MVVSSVSVLLLKFHTPDAQGPQRMHSLPSLPSLLYPSGGSAYELTRRRAQASVQRCSYEFRLACARRGGGILRRGGSYLLRKKKPDIGSINQHGAISPRHGTENGKKRDEACHDYRAIRRQRHCAQRSPWCFHILQIQRTWANRTHHAASPEVPSRPTHPPLSNGVP